MSSASSFATKYNTNFTTKPFGEPPFFHVETVFSTCFYHKLQHKTPPQTDPTGGLPSMLSLAPQALDLDMV